MTFARRQNLMPADVVIVPKSVLNIVDHYVVYWGTDANGIDYYVENIQGHGVRYITDAQFVAENKNYNRIRRFEGNSYERAEAVKRAISLVGARYNLMGFNCESYANYVQHSQSSSKQVNVGLGIAAGVALFAIFGGFGK